MELLVDPPSYRSFGLWAATEEQGRCSQVLGGSTESRWFRRDLLIVEDASADIASTRLRRSASGVSKVRPLFFDGELGVV